MVIWEKGNVGFRHLNPTYEIGDRINKHPKNQIITVHNNQFGALHFINALYQISDRTKLQRSAIALSKAKAITFLKFTQQDNGVAEGTAK